MFASMMTQGKYVLCKNAMPSEEVLLSAMGACSRELMTIRRMETKRAAVPPINPGPIIMWAKRLGRLGVVVPVDKCAGEDVVMCPALYLERMRKLYVENPGYRTLGAADVDLKAAEVRTTVRDLQIPGLQRPKKQHKFGHGQMYAKNKAIGTKQRPLVSYSGHIGKSALAAACRGGLHLLRHLPETTFMALTTATVVASLTRFSDVISGWGQKLTVAKYDIDNFYGNVPHALVDVALKWLFDMITAPDNPRGIGRRQFVLIPSPLLDRVAYLRTRNGVSEAWRQLRRYGFKFRAVTRVKFKPGLSSNRHSVARGWIAMKLSELRELILLDLRTGVVKWGKNGGGLWQLVGVPQGSPASVLVANLVAVYKEWHFRQWVKTRYPFQISQVRWILLRWVDDLFVAVATRNGRDEVHAGILGHVRNMYEPFLMKEEDASTFAGHRIFVTNDQIGICDANPNEQYLCAPRGNLAGKFVARLPHGRSCVPMRMKISVARGMMFRAIDCASHEKYVVAAMMTIVRELLTLEYPGQWIRRGMAVITRRYPFLVAEMERAWKRRYI